jgi:biotin operon repressor
MAILGHDGDLVFRCNKSEFVCTEKLAMQQYKSRAAVEGAFKHAIS